MARKRKSPDSAGDANLSGAGDARIQELQAQVAELKSLVEVLMARPTGTPLQADKKTETLSDFEEQLEFPHREMPTGFHFVEEMREGMSRALGGEEGETLEARVGGIWLGRMAVLLILTALIIGGTITLQDESIPALTKIFIGYAFGAIAIGYGYFVRNRSGLFNRSLMGFGLAIVFFTTYAGFFVQTARLFGPLELATPVLCGMLLAAGVFTHGIRSELSAGIVLLLLFYTAGLSLNTMDTIEDFRYAFVASAMLFTAMPMLHAAHRWMFFTWGVFLGGYLVYASFLMQPPPRLAAPASTYTGFVVGYLGLLWFSVSLACAIDARKTGVYGRTVPFVAAGNTIAFVAFTWEPVAAAWPDGVWAFRLGITIALLFLTWLARIFGPRYSHVIQIFAAETFLVLFLALQATFTYSWLLVALGAQTLLIAWAYRRSGLVIFKALGLVLLMFTFAGCLISIRHPDRVDLAGYSLPANWFQSVGLAAAFALTACIYEKLTRRVRAEERQLRGQWFLADSIWDMRPATIALIHAAGGALILTAVTIIELGDRPFVPFLLAIAAVAYAAVGLALRTPQVEIGSVLLLIASHVSYHAMLFMNVPGFESQDHYVALTVGLAILTYLGGYLWDRYLRKIPSGSMLEHHALAAIPYISATLLLTTLIERNLAPIHAPLAQNLLGVVLMLAGMATALSGLRICSVIAFALGTLSFLEALYNVHTPLSLRPEFLPAVVIMLGSYAAAERLILFGTRPNDRARWLPALLRSGFVGVAALVGIVGLWEWAPPEQVTFYWLGHAVGAMTLGVALRESRYRWAALFIYITAILRAYLYDLAVLNDWLQFVVFAALSIPCLIFYWGYAWWRDRQLRKLHAISPQQFSGDG